MTVLYRRQEDNKCLFKTPQDLQIRKAVGSDVRFTRNLISLSPIRWWGFHVSVSLRTNIHSVVKDCSGLGKSYMQAILQESRVH